VRQPAQGIQFGVVEPALVAFAEALRTRQRLAGAAVVALQEVDPRQAEMEAVFVGEQLDRLAV